MQSTITTPRLILTLIESVERGSQELEWVHELRSNREAMKWSIIPPSTSMEETEKVAAKLLPLGAQRSKAQKEGEEEEKKESDYRIAYAVHQRLPTLASTSSPKDEEKEKQEEKKFIGLIALSPRLPHTPTNTNILYLPPPFVPAIDAEKTLVVELAYALLPEAWGKGFGSEGIKGVLSCIHSLSTPSAPSSTSTPSTVPAPSSTPAPSSPSIQASSRQDYWSPYESVWMRVIVNERNGPSRGVMSKFCREAQWVQERGLFVWRAKEGEKGVCVGGEWRVVDELVVFGGWLKG